MRAVTAVLASAICLLGQTQSVSWRRVGGYGVDLHLASPAGGPAAQVWFSPDGGRLYARMESGAVFQTRDFENWAPAEGVAIPPEPDMSVAVERAPEEGVRVVSHGAQAYALAEHLYRSDDGGRSWTNLTAAGPASVIGSRQRSVAVSPRNPDELAVANERGVWRSVDGGLSWHGLNQQLPNLFVTRILGLPGNGVPLKVSAAGFGSIGFLPGSSAVWEPAGGSALPAEESALEAYSAALGFEVTAAARVADVVYAGAADGTLLASLDGGRTWPGVHPATGSAVMRIFADARQPRVALAVTESRVLRTTNSGAFWDDLTGDLSAAPLHGITADRSSGAVYVASGHGLFYAQADLDNPSITSISWSRVPGLPEAPVLDARLDETGRQLYVGLGGYGVYASLAPHVRRQPKIVNAADFSSRPAAPGSLLSVMGARVSSAQAGALQFPVLAASETESQIQVPFETNGPGVALAIEADSGRFTYPLPIQPVSPAIFIDESGTPMLLDADTELVLDAGNAARSNSRIQILATGLGRVVPAWPTGLPAPLDNVPEVASRVAAYLDRVPLQVTRATLAPGYIGFYLVELQLPRLVNAGPAELYIAVDGQPSNRVRIYIEP